MKGTASVSDRESKEDLGNTKRSRQLAKNGTIPEVERVYELFGKDETLEMFQAHWGTETFCMILTIQA